MNAHMKQPTGSAWATPKAMPEGLDEDLLNRWKSATSQVAHHASENGWSKSEVSRRANIAMGTFSGWYDGTYKGRYDTTTEKMENWLTLVTEAVEAMSALPVDPGFIQTRVARELYEAFTYAQVLPTMAVVILKSGLGKTLAAETFTATRPHVFHVTLSPSSRSTHTLKTEIGQQLGIDTRNYAALKAAIINALSRDGFSALLIVDEAQNLDEDGINELRHFHDLAKCGLVLLGNDESTTPYATRDVKHSSPQVSRRIGRRLTVMKPYSEDVKALLDAWGIDEPKVRSVGTKIAQKPGALGTLTETIKAASMIAAGMGRSVTAEDLRAAYQHRGGELI